MDTGISARFLAGCRQYLGVEYPTKIRLCLDVLPEQALWQREHDGSNSVGNLVLHLTGNVRQWIVSSVGGAPDVRTRAEEFSAKSGAASSVLWSALRASLDEADDVLSRLDARALLEQRTIQGRTVTVLDAVLHVVEHCSLHTGQIILLTKRHAPGAIEFYDDRGGLAVPVWRASIESRA